MKTLKHYFDVLERRIVRSILTNFLVAKWLSRHWLRLYLRLYYYNWIGKHLCYANPRDLNQALIKLSWQNSHNAILRELIPMCADKYSVRKYIAEQGYGDTLNKLYGVYDNVDDIDFNSLPDQFVVKMNNASGRNYICTDKSKCNWPEQKQQFAEWLKDNTFGWQTGEWQYGLIKPRIIIEKYMEDLGDISLIDYKFQCFYGKAYDIFVCYNRGNAKDDQVKTGEVCYDCYDLEWNRTENISPEWHKQRQMVTRPQNLQRMIQMAEDCTKDIPYCRFDVYEINGKIVFGEMTFTPHGNIVDFYTDTYLVKNKNLLRL
ncbi:MAG: hypothetical protein KBT27_14895 [Prevotellaceae bacterium]|nr:hypothetical protein [Candidatus Faecinaster equi]